MAIEIGVGVFDLIPSASGLSQNIAKELGATLDQAGAAAGQKASKSFGDTFAKGIRGAGGSLAGAVKSIGSTLANVGGLAALGGGILGAASVKGFAGFEQSLNVLQATSHATAAEMSAISKQAKVLGADMSLPATSAADAADAMTALARGGLSAKEAMDAARGTLQLSAAATVDVGSAALAVAVQIKAFALAGSDATHVADLLTGAVTNSGTTLGEFANGLSAVSATAHTAGVSLDDTVTATAELVKFGLDATEAGTALRNVILRLQSPTGPAAKAIKDLGLQVFDASGKMLPLRDIIDQLSKSVANLSDKKRAEAFNTIFGVRAVTAAQIFANNGVAAFDSLNSAVTKQGNAADIAGAKMKGLSGTLEGIKNAASTTGLSIGQVLQPAVQGVLNEMVGGVGKLSDFADAFQKALTPARLTQFGGIIKGVLGDVRSAIDGIEGPVAGVGAAIALTFGSKLPIIGQFIQPLGLVSGAFLGIIATSAQARGALVTFGKDMISVGAQAAPQLIKAVRTLQDAVGPAFARVVDGIDKAAVTLGPVLAGAVSKLAPPLAEVITQASRLVDGVLPRIADVIATVAPAITSVFGGALRLTGGLLKLLADNSTLTVSALAGLGAAFAAVKIAQFVSKLTSGISILQTFKDELQLQKALAGMQGITGAAATAGGSLTALSATARVAGASIGAAFLTAAPVIALGVGVGLLTKHFADNAAKARENKAAIQELTQAMISVGSAAGGVSTAVDKFRSSGSQAAIEFAHVGGKADELSRALTGSKEQWDAYATSVIKAAKAQGVTGFDLVDLGNSLVTLRSHTDAASKGWDAYQKSSSDVPPTQDQINQKLRETADALDGVVQATFASFDSQIAFTRSTNATTQAVKELQLARFFASKASAGDAAAQDRLTNASLSAQEAISSQANAAVRVAQDNAKSTGATLNYAQSLGVYRQELLNIKAANTDLAPAIDAILGRLDAGAAKAGIAGDQTGLQFVQGVSSSILAQTPAAEGSVQAFFDSINRKQAALDSLTNLDQFASPIIQSATQAFTEAVPEVNAAAAATGTAGAAAYQGALTQGINDGAGVISSAANKTVSDALSSAAFTALDEGAAVGADIAGGIATGVSRGSGTLSGAVAQIVRDGLAAGRAAAESKSPSKLFARELGFPLGQGVAVGIGDATGLVRAAGAQLVTAAAASSSAAVQTLIADAARGAAGVQDAAKAQLGAFIATVEQMEAKARAATAAAANAPKNLKSDMERNAKELTDAAEKARAGVLATVAAAFSTLDDYKSIIRDTAASVGVQATRIIAALAPTGEAFKKASQDAISFANSVSSSFHSAFDILGDFGSASADKLGKVQAAAQEAQQHADELRQSYVDAFSSIVSSLGASAAQQLSTRNLSVSALQDIGQAASSFASTMKSSFESTTGLVNAFGNETFVTGNQIVHFFQNQVKAAKKWATDLQALSQTGLDKGILQSLSEAGPKAEPLVKALLDAVKSGNLDAINQAQADLKALLGDTISTIGQSLLPAFEQGAAVGKQMSDGVAQGIVASSAAIQSQLQVIVQSAQLSTEEIVKLFTDQVDAAKTWADELGTLAQSGIDQGILRQLAEAGPKAEPLIKGLLSAIAAGNLDVINRAQADLGSLLQATIDTVGAMIAPALVQGTQVGQSLGDGIIAGIAASSPAIQEAVRQAVDGALQAAKDAAGIHSPSSVFADQVGLPIVQGTALGIRKSAFLVGNETAAMVKSAIPSASGIRAQRSTVAVPVGVGGGVPSELTLNLELDGKVFRAVILNPWAAEREAKQRRDAVHKLSLV